MVKPKISGTKMVRAPGKPIGHKARKGEPPKEIVNPLDPDLQQRKRV
jgi:hypothetical protein